MPGKYASIETYLRALPASQNEVTFSFEKLEGILKFKLPASAYEDDHWWRHEKEANHINTRAWANAGWKVERVEVNQKRVRLVRA